jgi:hypothetical protein
MRPGRIRVGAIGLVVGIIATGAGIHLLREPPEVAVQETRAAPEVRARPMFTPQAAPTITSSPPAPEQVPVSLSVESTEVAGPVVPVLAAPGGAVAVPDDPATVGWWAAGATPSSGTGSVVIVAHIDAAQFGAGPMTSLVRASLPTSAILTDSAGRTFQYSLTERRKVPKDELPADLFTIGGPARLVIITCGGVFDRRTGHYRDNVVVIGTPSS